jgi:hypothetical protein
MKVNHWIFLFFISLAMITLACQSVLPGSEETSDTTSSKVLFQDDFSDPDSGWDRVNDGEGINDYYNGGYRILVNTPNWYFWSNPGKSFTDVIIEVDAQKIAGPEENDMGIICRYQDLDNFYFFTIASDGYYGISKFKDGSEYMIGMDELKFNDKIINLGDSTNRIRVECIGDNLTLYANGKILADVQDSDFGTGDVGLIAGTYDAPGADVLFDNYIVLKP